MLGLWTRRQSAGRNATSPPRYAADDPRAETPETATRRLHHLERSRDAVRAKIERAYAADFTLTEAEQRYIQAAAREITAFWQRHDAPKKHLDRDPVQLARIAQAMQTAAREYLEAFFLLRVLEKRPDPNPGYGEYRYNSAPQYLYQTYANHLTNATEARFISCGVDALVAHRLNGFIIRNCIDTAEQGICDDPYIEPAQLRPRSELDALKQIDRLRHYWKPAAAGVGWKPPQR